jgi:hypothetical protein
MSPAQNNQGTATSATLTPLQRTPVSGPMACTYQRSASQKSIYANYIIAPPAVKTGFDDIFRKKFYEILEEYKNNPNKGPLTSKDRKEFIDMAWKFTDKHYFGGRALADDEVKLRALTAVFYKVLADEPWSDDFIRAPDVERKLSKFEIHKDSVGLAAQHRVRTPREAVAAARQYLAESKLRPKGPRGPWDDIEFVYIPGTVSARATAHLDRDATYRISALSTAHVLNSHICKDFARPFDFATKFIYTTDTDELLRMRKWACDAVDYAPHLLDNDNMSILVVGLILARQDICKRFEENGIRMEGTTLSHRRSECMRSKLGWESTTHRKPFDRTAAEFQTRVKNASNPTTRTARPYRPKSARKSNVQPIQYVQPAPGPHTPPMGYFPAPVSKNNGAMMPPRITTPRNSLPPFKSPYAPQIIPPPSLQPPPQPQALSRESSGPGASPDDPMDLS